MSFRHAKTNKSKRHVIHSFTYSDEAERLAANGFLPKDKYKFALQTDTEEFHSLVDPVNNVWKKFIQKKNTYSKIILSGDSFVDKISGENIDNYNVTIDENITKFGQGSYKFNGGTGTYLSTTNIDEILRNDFTIDLWAYRIGNTIDTIFEIGGWSANGLMSYLSGNYSRLFYNNHNDDAASFSGNYSINTWHHIAYTRSGDTFRCYLDGVYQGQTIEEANIVHNGKGLRISGYMDAGLHPHNGNIERFRFINGQALWNTDDDFTLDDNGLFYSQEQF